MTTQSRQELIDSLLLQEQLEAMDEFERMLVQHNRVPDRRRLPHKMMSPAIRVACALLLALNIAALVLLGNYVVFNMMIHASIGGSQ